MFCEGWHPERWPLYEAIYPVEDWTDLAEVMAAMRMEINNGTGNS